MDNYSLTLRLFTIFSSSQLSCIFSDTKMSESLSKSDLINIEDYLKPFGILTKRLDQYLNNKKPKYEFNLLRVYSCTIYLLMCVILLRAYVVKVLTGQRFLYKIFYSLQIDDSCEMMHHLIILYLTYTTVLVGLFFHSYNKHRIMEWLEPFQVLICKGEKDPQEFGLTIKGAKLLSQRIQRSFLVSRIMVLTRCVLAMFVFVAFYRIYIDLDMSKISSKMIFWFLIYIITTFYSSSYLWFSASLFDAICFYLQLRFKKVNAEMEQLIPTQSNIATTAKDIQAWRSILVEHNHICYKIHQYNKFWSRYILWSYLFLATGVLYSLFEILYVQQTAVMTKLFSWSIFELGYLLCKLSNCGSRVSGEVHSSYLNAVRASCDKYPLELRIQIRILIQRLSGPTIGFYCSNFFGLTSHSFYILILHLGQNFFLLVDFIISQKQAALFQDSQLNQTLNSDAFNNDSLLSSLN